MTHSQTHGVRPRGWLRLHLAGALPVLGLIFALLHGCPGCGGPQAPERPNVLWILWDTVRADRLSLYGYEKPTTPFLEQWARDALVFEDCLSTANYTVPAHASFFTGLLTSQHGAQNGRLYLDDEFTTIAEVLQSAGYRTYLYSANPHIAAEENFDQGIRSTGRRPMRSSAARSVPKTRRAVCRRRSAAASSAIGTSRRAVSWHSGDCAIGCASRTTSAPSSRS